MKRFAAHYLFLPNVGFVKQHFVEVTTEGAVQRVSPLTEEIESVEWFPGVIALLSMSDWTNAKNTGKFEINIGMFDLKHPNVSNQTSQCFSETLNGYKKREIFLFPFLFYPFDFTSMRPVDETQRRLLR